MTNFEKQLSRYGTYSTQWDYVQDRFGVKDLLPFSISDTDFMIPDGTIDVLTQAVDRGFFGYTRWNHLDYKESIVGWFARQFDTHINEEWCVYSPSVIYSLSIFIQLLSQQGGKILTLMPCYDAFFNCIKQNNRQLVSVSLKQLAQKFVIDFDILEETIKTEKPEIFLLCNPHNPTGRVFAEVEMKNIIALCNQYNVAIISDEIHMDVRRPEQQHLPILRFIDEIKVPVVLLSSASKTFNTPGLGGSYAIVHNQILREQFLAVLKGRDGLSSIPYLSLLAIMDCYNHQSEWLIQLNTVVNENFQVLKELLDTNPQIHFEIPEATYLGWIDLNDVGISMDDIQKSLVIQEKVAIMRGDTYGSEGYGFLRFNLGAPKEKIIDGGMRLLRALKEIKK